MPHTSISAVSFNGHAMELSDMPRGGKREGAGRSPGFRNPNAGRKPLPPGHRLVSTTLSLSPDLLDRLDKLATRKGTSRSRLVNAALKKFLK